VHWKVKSYDGDMRIGELAAATGLTSKTLRFYEEAGLLPDPPRTNAGYRDYPGTAARRLGFIRDAQAAGFSLAEIRGILVIHDSGDPPCQHVAVLIDEHLVQVRRRIAELRAAEDALRELASRAAVTDPRDCTAGGICTIFPEH
jgi:DNA-binding transcriptional MerR regulator